MTTVYDDVISQYDGRLGDMRRELGQKYNVAFPDNPTIPVRTQLEGYYEKVVFDKLVGIYNGSPGKTVDDLWLQLADRYKVTLSAAKIAKQEQNTKSVSTPPKPYREEPVGVDPVEHESPARDDPAASKVGPSPLVLDDVSHWCVHYAFHV